MRENNMSAIQTNISAIMNAATNNCTKEQKEELEATGQMVRPFASFAECGKLQKYGMTVDKMADGGLFVTHAEQPSRVNSSKANLFEYETPNLNDRWSLKMTSSSTGEDPQVDLKSSHTEGSFYKKKPNMTSIARTANQLLAYCKPEDIRGLIWERPMNCATPPPEPNQKEYQNTSRTANEGVQHLMAMLSDISRSPTNYHLTVMKMIPIVEQSHSLHLKYEEEWALIS